MLTWLQDVLAAEKIYLMLHSQQRGKYSFTVQYVPRETYKERGGTSFCLQLNSNLEHVKMINSRVKCTTWAEKQAKVALCVELRDERQPNARSNEGYS